ncbi:MAG: glucokinase [Myxococcales bacterium]|nr:glucokinase [Myxococcales bacterium]
MAEMLLAGDVGGTNARLSLLSRDGRKVLRRDALPSREYPSLEAAVRVFLGDDRVKAAAIGVAGPVLRGRCNATNLPWSIDERALSKRLGIPKVTLQNDLVVAAYGALEAPPRTVELLWGERRPRGTGGNVAILAAGTGLGEAALVWDGERHVSLATEGGHVDFAPRSELEARLLLFLRKRLGKRVSYERVLSGPGIGHLYDFFHGAEGARETAPNLTKLAKATDRNAAITELALSKKSRPGARAIDLSCPSLAPRREISRSRPSPPAASSSLETSPDTCSLSLGRSASWKRSSTRGEWNRCCVASLSPS